MKIIIAIVIAITVFVLIKAAIKANKSNTGINPVSPPLEDEDNNDKKNDA